jgi:2-iminobutanoate/2-iminopropanoate deaminase
MLHVTTADAAAPSGAYSHAVRVNTIVTTAGQVGKDPATGSLPSDLEYQVRLAIQNLERVLEAAGSSLDRIIKTTCYLTDIRSFAAFDAIYAELIPEPRPARSTVGVALAGGLLFEIEAVAACDNT